MSVLPLYVTEILFEDDAVTQERVLRDNQDGWPVKDVTELIKYMDDSGSLPLTIEGKGLYVNVDDYEELAQWSLDNGLEAYTEKGIPNKKPSVDITLDGQDYTFVWLIGEVLADFLYEAVDSIESVDSIPNGLSLFKFHTMEQLESIQKEL